MGAAFLGLEVFLLWSFLGSSVYAQGHFENVALNKTCNMSSLYNRDGPSPTLAVDGNTCSSSQNGYVSTTAEDNPWLEVNLGRPHPVHNITIWARPWLKIRMAGCVITIDGQECYKIVGTPTEEEIPFTCSSGVLNGSVVRVYKVNTPGPPGEDGEYKAINLCEIQIFSCSDGNWGSGCDRRCGNCSNSEVCDKVTGHCSSCPPGLQPPLCDTECSSGNYGMNCMQACSEHCNDTCNKATGNCTCKPGYSPPLCSTVAESLNMPTEDNSSLQWILIGVVGGSVVVLAVCVIIIVIVRRRRNRLKATKKQETRAQETRSDQPPAQHVNVYQNLTDKEIHGDKTDHLPGASDHGVDTKPAIAPKPVPKKKKSQIKTKPAATTEGVTYVNVAFEENGVDQGNPSCHESPRGVDTIAANRAMNPAEEEDVDIELDETEVDPEVERQYDVEVRERVYYNDGVYMTSAGASLKLDTVQESLLEKLRSEVIDEEFESLPVGLTKAHDTGADDENYYRNRFRSILPYEDNRVVLLGDPDPGSNDYINASYISGVRSTKAYIAAQGPNRKTVPDFWKMVWQEQVTHIVMLTNLKEGKKKKCEQYWPPPGEEMRYGSVDVTGLEEHERANYVMRTFDIARKNGAVRRVTQYHYTMWPDHGIPTTTGLVDFWRTVTASHRQQPQSSPLLVHCSAGVGRTGTFIGLDIVMDQLQQQQHVDIFTVVKHMRDDRCNMIQAKSQYCILHEAVLEAYTSEGTRLSHQEFDSVFKHQVDPHHANTRIDTEFKKLKQMTVLMQKPRHTEAEKAENINKNRYLDILPDDRYLARLITPVENRSDYINAVYMPTYRDQEGSILTQLPLKDTIVDLWRLVTGNDIRLIVSLGSEIVQSEGCYWPREENQPLTCGPFIIRLTSRTLLRKHIVRYSLSVQCKGKARPRSVEVFQHGEWQGDTASSVEDLLHLLTTLRSTPPHQQQHGTPPLLLQCSDGATKSGLFHAICDVINRMTSEGIIDVFVAVRHMQIVRPQCLMSKVQYRFIYRAVQEYRRNNDTYANAPLDY